MFVFWIGWLCVDEGVGNLLPTLHESPNKRFHIEKVMEPQKIGLENYVHRDTCCSDTQMH